MQKTKMKKRCRDGVTCVVLCTLPSIYLVCVVFGTAIPTSFHILENVFHTCSYLTLLTSSSKGCSSLTEASDNRLSRLALYTWHKSSSQLQDQTGEMMSAYSKTVKLNMTNVLPLVFCPFHSVLKVSMAVWESHFR